jgi:CheY-like chemotaxis protein
MSLSTGAKRRIGDLVVEAGLLTRDALERLISTRPELSGQRLLSDLYQRGAVPERPLAEVLATHMGTPVAVLSETTIDLNAVRSVTDAFLREQGVIPLSIDAHAITVCVSDVEQTHAQQQIAFALGKRVIPVLGLAGVLAGMIEPLLAAARKGHAVFPVDAAHAEPRLVVATRQLPRDEADALARAIIAAVEGSDGQRSKALGAVRLKTVLVPRSAEGAPVIDASSEPGVRDDVALPPGPMEAGPPVALVVDDDADVRLLLKKLIEPDGIVVHEASTGDEAVSYLRQRRPHIVLLDGLLPGIHGFEICSAMKRSSTLSTIPVIMISAAYRGLQLAHEITEVHGADYFLEKPLDRPYVRRLVSEALRRKMPRPPRAADVEHRVEATRQRYEQHVAQGLALAATADLETWLALDPFDGRAWVERGAQCGAGGDWVSAMGAYEVACVYGPDLLWAHVGLAVVAEKLGFVRRARSAWLRAHQLAPDAETRAKIDAHLGT